MGFFAEGSYVLTADHFTALGVVSRPRSLIANSQTFLPSLRVTTDSPHIFFFFLFLLLFE
jgi:hypothetical protein